MINDERPDPDALLRAVLHEEQKTALGRLKIFFGMSAGVGKTYAMLDEAHQRAAEGVNLIIGTINTHGRIETEKLLEGLPLLSEKWIEFKGKAFKELDIEKILELKPQLVLIDELAHTNVPGSKHPKRWQDVIEILDAGIDVYTTLNVQHLETRKDLVESIIGIPVHETVPDLILERASAIELVDITPTELLQRLKEGKVYLGDQSKLAAENFFQEEHLTALREIALRFTAEKVDHDLHGILALGKGWKVRERLMVAITPAYSSQLLIRSARRLAFELDAPWIAVYVNTGKKLNSDDQSRLNKNLQLAEHLGAEVIITNDLDVPGALQRIAKQKSITRLVIGRPTELPFFKKIFQKSLIDRLEQENKQMDILILRQDKLLSVYKRAFPSLQFSSSALSYLAAGGSILFLTFISSSLTPWIGQRPIGYLFLVGILILSLFFGRGPIFLAAVLSTLSLSFLFIPPLLATLVPAWENGAVVLAYFCAAITVGLLAERIREKDRYLYQREERIEHLYEIMSEITKSPNLQYLRLNVGAKLKSLFGGEFDILAKKDDQHPLNSQIPILTKETEKAAAQWCLRNGKPAGWSTHTLPSAEAIYLPIKFSKITIGALIYIPKDLNPLSPDEMNFLETVTDQLGLYLERYVFEERLQSHHYAIQVEKLHNAIFHSLSKGFYTPLDKISEINQKLKLMAHTQKEKLLFEEMNQAQYNLKMIVDNILTISQLESGFVPFEKKKNSIKALIEQASHDVQLQYNDRSIGCQLPEEDLFFDFDFKLMQIALKNLLINALEYSPPDKSIRITVEVLDQDFKISILDEGGGISQKMIPYIFEKFYRLPGEKLEGIGLGLTVVKAVVDIHQGKMEVQSEEGKGTRFSLILPK